MKLLKYARSAQGLQRSSTRAERQVMIRKSDGFALIDVLFVCGIISVLCTIALPRMLLARQSASAASAIGSMRAINSAQLTFALTCGSGFYAPSLTALGAAPPGSREGFISPNLGGSDAVTRSGYLIQVSATPFAGAPATCNGLEMGETSQAFKAGADALEPTNSRFFATNANGQIFEHTATIFSTMPETGEPVTGHVLR
jgi:type II secretory pathway pseudopilin PulG